MFEDNPEIRRDRKALLLVSLIASFVAFTGSIPEKFPSLGMDFSTHKEILPWGLAVVLFYFLVLFVARAYASVTRQVQLFLDRKAHRPPDSTDRLDARDIDFYEGYSFSSGRGIVRIALLPRPFLCRVVYLEFWLPVAIGLFSLGWLLWRIWVGFQPVVFWN